MDENGIARLVTFSNINTVDYSTSIHPYKTNKAMKYIAMCAYLLVLIIPLKSERNFLKINKEMERLHQIKTKHILKTKQSLFYKARMEAYKNSVFLKLLNQSDTIYVLETYEYELGLVQGRIWNKLSSIDYTYRITSKGPEFRTSETPLFTQIQIALVTSWDLKSIRNEESRADNQHLDSSINAFRGVVNHKKVSVDGIDFNDFYNPNRDLIK